MVRSLLTGKHAARSGVGWKVPVRGGVSVSDTTGIIQLIGRILIGAYFIYTGVGFHVAKTKMAEQYAGGMRFPVPAIAGWPTGLWMATGGLSVVLGIWPDIGALMIAAFAIVAAAYFHRFWELDDQMQKQTQQQLFFRNVIIVGACLVMFAFFTAAGDALRYSITGPAFDL
jgi:putative oxidoreductase